ncbi:MAG: CPBP family intramembrane glutamic endopeptidase [Verrucomicrobiota bacterium]
MNVFINYFLSTLSLAGLLAPVSFFILDGFISYPFYRYINRCLMISAVVMLFVFRHGFRLEPRWKSLGFDWDIDTLRQIWSGIIIGGLTILFVVTMEWMIGVRHGGGSWEFIHVATSLLQGILTAILVAPLEEFLFRWMIQGRLTQPLMEWKGIMIGAFIFAVVHLFKVPPSFRPTNVEWYSGFQGIYLMFGPLLDIEGFGVKLLSLWFVGITLGILVLRTGTLWASIALHGVWIFVIQVTSKLTVIPPGIESFWLSRDIISGGIAMFTLAILTVVIWVFYPRYTRT